MTKEWRFLLSMMCGVGVLYQSMVGLLRQYTARPEPPRAMKTTETAEGTATRGSEKCVWASRKPRAALCMPASCSTPLSGKPLQRGQHSYHGPLRGI